MTNGEKLKSIFPNMRIDVFSSYVDVMGENYEFYNQYPLKWWNAEYKEPTTKNDLGVDAAVVPFLDTISRQEAIDTIRQLYLDLASQKAVIDILKVLPSVTPIRPKGHWIGHREHCENLGVIPSGLGAYEWCSNCDCGIDVREWHRNHYNYCPNCGAIMVEPQESELENPFNDSRFGG